MVIRTQKDNKLQILFEVCTDFSSFTAPTHTHRPAEQTLDVHQPMEASCTEEDCKSEAMFAVGDRPPWTGRGASELSVSPTLQYMFALARRMGYEMSPIARWVDTSRQPQGTDRLITRIGGFALRHVPVLAWLSHRFYWSGMADDVKDWLGQCTVCMKRKSPTGIGLSWIFLTPHRMAITTY